MSASIHEFSKQQKQKKLKISTLTTTTTTKPPQQTYQIQQLLLQQHLGIDNSTQLATNKEHYAAGDFNLVASKTKTKTWPKAADR